MAISNYTRPQFTIAQILAEIASPSADRMIPLIIGPQYLLSRYGKEDSVYSEKFDTAGSSLPYKYMESGVETSLASGYIVDQDSVKIQGVGMQAQLAEFLAADSGFKIESVTTPNVIQIQSNNVKGDGTLNATFLGREVELGDLVYVYEDDSTAAYKKRVVTGFKGTTVAATLGDATNSAYNPATDATADATATVTAPTGWTAASSGTADFNVRGGTVTGTKLSEEFTITVRTSGAPATATVDITSKSGGFTATGVATADDAGTGYDITDAAAGGELAGVDINLDQGGDELVQGQIFKVVVYQAYERLNDGTTDQITTSGTYTGPKDTTYLIKVKTGTAVGGDTATASVVTITDTAGVDDTSTVTVTNDTAFNLGTYGLTAKIALDTNTVAQGGLRSGDVYPVTVTAEGESATLFDKIILDGPAVDTTVFTDAAVAIKAQFRMTFDGDIASDSAADEVAWTADEDSVELESATALHVSTRSSGNEWVPFVDGVGDVHVSFRASVPALATEDRVSIDSVDDILEELGSVDLDNDLAFGVSEALSGVQGLKRVYALRTGGNELSDYTTALRKVESTDAFYAIAVLSDDLDIQQAVTQHCDSMSSKTKKNFRRCYVGTNSPGSYAVLTVQSDDSNYTATVSDMGGSNVLLTTTDEADFTSLGLESGDLVKLTATDEEYKIRTIISATEIELESGPDSPVSPAVPFQLWRANTASSQKDYVIARSKALSSRRCVNVWQQGGTRSIDDVKTEIPNKFVACEIAGLRCALLPQQGLTNTEITSIDLAPAMYVTFDQDDLDEIAANGTMIVTQEDVAGDVFIRHQLTTQSDNGSLYYEDSVGVNFDNISFLVKDNLAGFVGKKNVNSKTLAEINRVMQEILAGATQVPANAEYGPALNGFEDLVVAVHEVLKDRITVNAKLLMPLPLNNLEVELEGDVDLSI